MRFATGQWLARGNRQFVRAVRTRHQQLLQHGITAHLHWIRAHRGNAYNERTDELAKLVVQGLNSWTLP